MGLTDLACTTGSSVQLWQQKARGSGFIEIHAQGALELCCSNGLRALLLTPHPVTPLKLTYRAGPRKPQNHRNKLRQLIDMMKTWNKSGRRIDLGPNHDAAQYVEPTGELCTFGAIGLRPRIATAG